MRRPDAVASRLARRGYLLGVRSGSRGSWRAHLQLVGLAPGERVATTARVRDAFIEAGAFITDVHLFGGLQTTLGFEAGAHHLEALAEALARAGLHLDAPSLDALHAAARTPGEVRGTLAVVFVKGDPNLRHEIPSVPG